MTQRFLNTMTEAAHWPANSERRRFCANQTQKARFYERRKSLHTTSNKVLSQCPRDHSVGMPKSYRESPRTKA